MGKDVMVPVLESVVVVEPDLVLVALGEGFAPEPVTVPVALGGGTVHDPGSSDG